MIIVPARLQSVRMPQKVLADIFGMPMVVRTAKVVSGIDRTCVATDSKEVLKVCQDHGIEAILTPECESGTNRIACAATTLKLDDEEVIINVQADEPFIEPWIVKLVLKEVKKQNAFAVSCYKKTDAQEAQDANLVKVVTSVDDYALYFSRSKIPFSRDKTVVAYKGHLGIYGFLNKNLQRFCGLMPTTLEQCEKLEQLRILENGCTLKMLMVQTKSFGIDTPQDLQKALTIFKS